MLSSYGFDEDGDGGDVRGDSFNGRKGEGGLARELRKVAPLGRDMSDAPRTLASILYLCPTWDPGAHGLGI